MDKMVKGVVFLIEYRDDDKLVNVDLPEKLSHYPVLLSETQLEFFMLLPAWDPFGGSLQRVAFFMGEDVFFFMRFRMDFRSSTLEALRWCHGSWAEEVVTALRIMGSQS